MKIKTIFKICESQKTCIGCSFHYICDLYLDLFGDIPSSHIERFGTIYLDDVI